MKTDARRRKQTRGKIAGQRTILDESRGHPNRSALTTDQKVGGSSFDDTREQRDMRRTTIAGDGPTVTRAA